MFQLSPQSGGGRDGSGPQSGLTLAGGSLYGVTCCGTEGTVFRMAKNATPYGSVAVNSKGVVFGTTSAGGKYGAGIVFALIPVAPGKPYAPISIHDFTGGTDGGSPYGGMTLGTNGTLYVTVSAGGTYGVGGALSFAPTGGGPWTETDLHDFTGGSDGGEPYAGVVFGGDGALYGTTAFNGAGGYGTVFRLTP